MYKPRLALYRTLALSTCLLALVAGATLATNAALIHNKPTSSVLSAESGAKNDNPSAQVSKAIPAPHFITEPSPVGHSEAVTPPPVALPRLSGIMIGGAVKHAIFDNGNTSQVNVVGDHLGPYRVVDIAPDAVTIEGPQGTAILHPDSDGGNSQVETSVGAAGSQQPSLLDQLNTQPPPVVAMPRPPSLTQMLSRLPRSH